MYPLFTTLTILLLMPYYISAQDNSAEFRRTAEDIAFENTNNCRCIAYFSCLTQQNFTTLPHECSNEYYMCCQVGEEDRETTTQSDMDTRTEKLKEMYESPKCGEAKHQLDARFGSDDDTDTSIPGEFPWLVEIFQKTKYGIPPYKFKCLGSLIHPKVILTTTQCVVSPTEDLLKIVATGKEVFQNVGVNEANERSVEKIIKHPDYYSGGLYNNIALLILTEQYKYGEYPINSICLPSPNQVFTGKTCSVAGWGENRNLSAIPLRKVSLSVIEPEECQKLLRKPGRIFNLHSSTLCAGGEEGKGTCKGDGGSPLICMRDDYRFVQVGISSWGHGCGVANNPEVYTDVAKFKNWIVQEAAKYGVKL